MKSDQRKIREERKAFQRSRLPNGVTVLTEKAKGFQTLAMGIWVKAGSRDELDSESGMAHFLEHMIFKGTSRRSSLEISRAVDLVGGDFNAMTSREYTCFHITLPVSQLAFAVELLAEVLIDSQFNATEMERERQVIIQEIQSSEDSPEDLIFDELMSSVYGKHPLARLITGTEEIVQGFKREQLMDFFAKHYSIQDLIVTVAGDIEHKEVVSLLKKSLRSPERRKMAKGRRPKRRPPKFIPGLSLVKRDYEQSHVTIAFPTFPAGHKQHLPTFLLNAFFGGGMSSTLFQSIREQRGLAYTVYSSLMPHSDSGLMETYLATSPKQIGECLAIVAEEVRKLSRNLLSKEDLTIIQNSIKSAVLLGGDSMETRMTALAKSEIYYPDFRTNSELCGDIDGVTADQIRAAARIIFSVKPRVIVLGDFPKKEVQKAYEKSLGKLYAK